MDGKGCMVHILDTFSPFPSSDLDTSIVPFVYVKLLQSSCIVTRDEEDTQEGDARSH